MPRISNIFHNLVTDEDSTTELLCNLMRFAAFRRPLLARFLSEASAKQIAYEDVETQVDLGRFGRPDVIIRNDELCALVEVKVTQYQGPTGSQPEGYFSFLLKDKTPERWLIFLVPEGWVYLRSLEESLGLLNAAHRDGSIRTRVMYWEDVLAVIEENDLQALNPFLGEFHQLLVARLRPMATVFSKMEVIMLFSKDFRAALSALRNLDQLIGQIQEKSSAYKKSRLERTRALCPEYYGVYFRNARDENVLWFGVWTEFWRQEGIPLCFGVDDKWPTEVREAFRVSYKGSTKRFQNWTLGWVSQEALASDDVVEQVWAQLSRVLEAVVSAGE